MDSARVASVQDAELFVAVVDAASLSAAARRLGLSQPSVSRRLAALEERLGVRLLDRDTRRLRLTTAGRTYYERCLALVEMARETEALVAEMNGALRGTLRLSAPPTYARRRIAPLLAEFARTYPDIRLQMVLSEQRASVIGDGLDLVVRLGRLDDSALTCRLLSRERFVLCASPDYLERTGVPSRIEDLAGRHGLVTEAFGMRGRIVFGSGSKRRSVQTDALLTSDDLEMLREGALLGLGVTALPEYLVGGDIERGRLVRLLARERLPAFEAHAVFVHPRRAPRRVRAFVDFLASRLGRRAAR